MTKPWLTWEDFVQQSEDDQDADQHRVNAKAIVADSSARTWHAGSVDQNTSMSVLVERKGTFLDKTEFKNKYGHTPEKLGIAVCDVPTDDGKGKVRGVLFLGEVNWDYRVVTLQVRREISRKEILMPPDHHVVPNQDAERFWHESKVAREEKGAVFRTPALKPISHDLVMKKKQDVEPEAGEPASDDGEGAGFFGEGTCAKVAVPASVASFQAKKSPAHSPRDDRSQTASVILTSVDDKAESVVDNWIQKLNPTAVLGGWKPGRLTGHAEARAAELMQDDKSKLEGRRLRRHLHVVECARLLNPEALSVMDDSEVSERLGVLVAAKVNFPSTFKEALFRVKLSKVVAALAQQPHDATIINKIMDMTNPFKKSADEVFDAEIPTLRQLDMSPADLAGTFGKIVVQERLGGIEQTSNTLPLSHVVLFAVRRPLTNLLR